ncbi:hypothetical protein J1N35_022358 [Gossypium stocksii]|uniref:Uncharacterized protein n=1 Tax=Gossypium stocksii TaxID=47602 RepID=A0A9D4A2P4_9ROSI|nr:hypothetical protein J1N35_022358 [Gossypium stocksii]
MSRAPYMKVITVNNPKRLGQHEKWKVVFGIEDEDDIYDDEENDEMVVSAMVAGFQVKRMLVDNESAVKVLT